MKKTFMNFKRSENNSIINIKYLILEETYKKRKFGLFTYTNT